MSSSLCMNAVGAQNFMCAPLEEPDATQPGTIAAGDEIVKVLER